MTGIMFMAGCALPGAPIETAAPFRDAAVFAHWKWIVEPDDQAIPSRISSTKRLRLADCPRRKSEEVM